MFLKREMKYHLPWALFFVRICWYFHGNEAWEFQNSELTVGRERKMFLKGSLKP